MDKIDARKLSVESRAMLRQMVLRLRKQSRMTADQLAVVAGVHPSTIKKWLALARRQGEGALQEKRRGRPVGACRKLSLAQEMWIRQHIVEHTPEQMKLPFALWSRPAIRALLAEQFGLEISERLMGKYLKRWGFTPQRPVKRALEQDPVRVAAW
ncbi:MAG: winged helix-turn-helix domain-containing protein, partial [Thiomonas sp.]